MMSLRPVPGPPRQTLARTLAVLTFMPAMLVLTVILGLFVKDAEALLMKLVPLRIQALLRDTRVTWTVFSQLNFFMGALVASVMRPRLARRFMASQGVTRVSYGPSAWQRITLFRKEPRDIQPLVVFVHGGVWCHSRDWNYRLVARRLQSQGYAAAVVGFRVYPEKCVPDMAQDVCSSLAWLRDHASTVGVDSSRVALLGHSSGGHLCAMAALAGEGPRLAGVATMGSPFDVPDHYDFESGRGVAAMSPLLPACGGPENFARVSPTRFLQSVTTDAAWDASALPPFFVGHGVADTTVPPTQAEKFAAALKAAGAPEVELSLWDGVGHGGPLVEMMGMSPGKENEVAVRTVFDFLRRKLRPALADAEDNV